MSKLLWPIFVYSFLDLVSQGYSDDAKTFLSNIGSVFEKAHADDLKTFTTISLPAHVTENEIAKLYRGNKYRIPLNQHATGDLYNFLERETDQGGSVIRQLLISYCQIDSTARGPITPYSFEAVLRRAKNVDLEDQDANEGIPGVKIGITNKDVLDPSAPVTLGPLPMEQELKEDLRAEIEDEDARNPPQDGRVTLLEELDQKIKREESADAPNRADLPLPPSRPRDILLEMSKLRENRDRFKIEGRTGGSGLPISACMFTFHNTLGAYVSLYPSLSPVRVPTNF